MGAIHKHQSDMQFARYMRCFLQKQCRIYATGRLRLEHRDLDDAIHRLTESVCIDQLQLRRMKKRKLILKDAIDHFESMLIPDLDA